MNAHDRELSPARPPLSPRQRQVLDFIVKRIESFGYPPTIREICRQFEIRSTNGVADHLKALTRKGYLTHQECKSRTLRPVRPATAPAAASANAPAMARPTPLHATGRTRAPKLASVPLLGRVAAGQPILAVEEARPEDNLLVDPNWVGATNDVFALQVTGDSMVEDGILNGDTVFVRRRDTAQSGETVVVLIDNEATLKRYFPEGNRVRLQPANAAMKPIYLQAEQARRVQIVGVVIGVYRRI